MAPGCDGFAVSADARPRRCSRASRTSCTSAFAPDARRAQAFGAVQIHAGERHRHAACAVRAGASWLLTLMVFFPLVGAALILLAPRGRHDAGARARAGHVAGAARRRAVTSSASTARSTQAAGNGGLQFVQHVVWIPVVQRRVLRRRRRPSVTMVLLTALVSTIAVARQLRHRQAACAATSRCSCCSRPACSAPSSRSTSSSSTSSGS